MKTTFLKSLIVAIAGLALLASCSHFKCKKSHKHCNTECEKTCDKSAVKENEKAAEAPKAEAAKEMKAEKKSKKVKKVKKAKEAAVEEKAAVNQ